MSDRREGFVAPRSPRGLAFPAVRAFEPRLRLWRNPRGPAAGHRPEEKPGKGGFGIMNKRRDRCRPVAAGARRGYTLVELLVVIVVIALLAALALGALGRVRESGNSAACLKNLRQIGAAAHGYAADNNGVLPAMQDSPTGPGNYRYNWAIRLAPYLGLGPDVDLWSPAIPKCFKCPSDHHAPAKTGVWLSYGWNFYDFGFTDNRGSERDRREYEGYATRLAQITKTRTVLVGDSCDNQHEAAATIFKQGLGWNFANEGQSGNPLERIAVRHSGGNLKKAKINTVRVDGSASQITYDDMMQPWSDTLAGKGVWRPRNPDGRIKN